MIIAETSLLVGVIGGAHGVRGALRIMSFTDDPLRIADYGALHDKTGRLFAVHPLHLHKKSVIAHIDGIKNREQADGLKGVKLYLKREQLPEIQEEDEFYQQDLIGLAVFCLENQLFGAVKAVFNFGGGDILEIRDNQDVSHLIPFSRAAVPIVDLKQHRLVVDIKAAGLSFPDADEAI